MEADVVFCVVSINTASDLPSESTNASADIDNQYKLYIQDCKYDASLLPYVAVRRYIFR